MRRTWWLTSEQRNDARGACERRSESSACIGVADAEVSAAGGADEDVLTRRHRGSGFMLFSA